MREYSLKINLGIGDIVYTKAALDNIKNDFDIINISPNYSVIDQYRDGDKWYKEFVDELFLLLFNERPYNIVNDLSLPLKSLIHLMEDGISLCVPDLSNYFVNTNSNGINKKYITISTKVRGLRATDYVIRYRDILLDTLQFLDLYYNIYIIGERIIGYNKEYDYHNGYIFSIYDDLKECKNIKDVTIEELGKTVPTLKQIKEDCSLMHHAEVNICLGIGGNFSLAASVGKLINFRATKGDAVDCTFIIYKNEIGDRVFSTDDFKLFIHKLEDVAYNHKS